MVACTELQSSVTACTRAKSPVEQLALLHGITLPNKHQLPPSYSMRMWLTRRIASMQGRHKLVWQRIKNNPQRMEAHRQGSKMRMQRFRARAKMPSLAPA